jgi:hypothetical protein
MRIDNLTSVPRDKNTAHAIVNDTTRKPIVWVFSLAFRVLIATSVIPPC